MLVSCATGQASCSSRRSAGLGPEVVPVRGAGATGPWRRHPPGDAARSEDGDVFALNGDELVDVDLQELLALHRGAERRRRSPSCRCARPSAWSTSTTTLVTGFREAPRLEHWVSCGVYVLGEEAIERLPERGDHETTTFPELAAEGRLQSPAARGNLADGEHPQDLRVADDYLAENPGWPAGSRG